VFKVIFSGIVAVVCCCYGDERYIIWVTRVCPIGLGFRKVWNEIRLAYWNEMKWKCEPCEIQAQWDRPWRWEFCCPERGVPCHLAVLISSTTIETIAERIIAAVRMMRHRLIHLYILATTITATHVSHCPWLYGLIIVTRPGCEAVIFEHCMRDRWNRPSMKCVDIIITLLC